MFAYIFAYIIFDELTYTKLSCKGFEGCHGLQGWPLRHSILYGGITYQLNLLYYIVDLTIPAGLITLIRRWRAMAKNKRPPTN